MHKRNVVYELGDVGFKILIDLGWYGISGTKICERFINSMNWKNFCDHATTWILEKIQIGQTSFSSSFFFHLVLVPLLCAQFACSIIVHTDKN